MKWQRRSGWITKAKMKWARKNVHGFVAAKGHQHIKRTRHYQRHFGHMFDYYLDIPFEEAFWLLRRWAIDNKGTHDLFYYDRYKY